ncbi:hypothetical protein OG887_21170 [Streptomyces sp. NBC_00053]|uniref:hypothetical protein n=1 Tax=unclassified Streptomyces TaxID=2593676 RepID=UPI00224FEB90|nr:MULTISPECIES: hypothetical protein [unclassified Streptomyces]MCX5501869.1 hypothetical protein [Streptomyces sp. NBC_00052]MCX5549595.1 hypothetical protein [Streptomyces sp. NBC_00051]
MSGIMEKINRNWWVLPILAFVCALMCLLVISLLEGPRLLAGLDPDLRKDIYSSLAGSSSGLLGFALAAVAILSAFAPKVDAQGANRRREREMAEARNDIAKCLIVTSLFLMMILVMSTIGIGIDSDPGGNRLISAVIISASFASLVGLLISGLGVTLSILERNDQSR